MFGISQTTLSLNFIPGMKGSHHGVSHHRNVTQNPDSTFAVSPALRSAVCI
jgi:hypothetical protein